MFTRKPPNETHVVASLYSGSDETLIWSLLPTTMTELWIVRKFILVKDAVIYWKRERPLSSILAGNRWHLTCFRCNTCGELLDSDANLLLLGDGSLICNNCTYSCSACNNKIEDLAILTGDQAFCASCFRCRNCKRKIENLRYARTSQGIFCMSCHESLMARRKKKSKSSNAKLKRDDQSSALVDKSLPALPPNASAQAVHTTERKTSEQLEGEMHTELSPRPHQGYLQNDSSSRSSSRKPRERSLERASGDEYNPDGMKLLAKLYRKNRHSAISQASDLTSIDNESFFIPLALDPASAPETWQDSSKNRDNKYLDRDYFALSRQSSKTHNEIGKSSHQSSAASTPQKMPTSQARAPPSDDDSTVDNSLKASSSKPSLTKTSTPPGSDGRGAQPTKPTDVITRGQASAQRPNENFTLGEPPKGKSRVRNDSPSGFHEGTRTMSTHGEGISSLPSQADNTAKLDSFKTSSPGEKFGTGRPGLVSRTRDGGDTRPSLDLSAPINRTEYGGTTKSKIKKDVSVKVTTNMADSPSGADNSTSSPPDSPNSVRTVNSRTTHAQSVTASSTSNDRQSHLHSLARPSFQQQLSNTYMSPRAPPPPPQAVSIVNKDSHGPSGSQGLPRWSQGGGDFTMDEDFARILGEQEDQSQSLFRRVSNAVRHGKNASEIISSSRPGHGRSASETTTARTTNSPRWPKSSKIEHPGALNETKSSAISSLSDETALLRRQLRGSEQRVVELEYQFFTEKDLKNLAQRVQEKRKTVSVLDSQSEIMMQQIDILSRYLDRAKKLEPGQDLKALENSAIKDFAMRLEEIKQNVTESIEQLYEERNDLLEEKIQIMADRDRALIEFEQLSSKNAQLADLNNDLTHQIQERFKSHSSSIDSSRPQFNGLGIYAHPSKNKSSVSMNLDDISLRPSTSTTLFSTASAFPQANEQESNIDPLAVLSAPHVVNIRKGQATKKTFNWKRGRQTVAKGVSKGIKGAFSSTQQQQQQQTPLQEPLKWPNQNTDGIGLPYNLTFPGPDNSTSVQTMTTNRNASIDQKNPGGFGLFKKSSTVPKLSSNGNSISSERPSTLFGSELCERADYEHRQIPSVVTRCIEEVELRGMDIEGIYRKTGGNSQVKTIQEGFERDEDFDISDPALDITAVTSVLKQYLRKLPTPLLTFSVYDRILESTSIEDNRDRCLHLRHTFSLLPPKHRDCLEFLIFHLTRVAVREKENLMSPKNLAVVFAPTIMRDTSLEREMTDMHVKNGVVQFIIENSYDIFGAP
ncbi:GTPase-activating protein [Golovinomyces cichoracearum]|uniref:GTPase-activating protein n=1 Tax=Golovinomyces cichoracearum TaxID=62708 RepID=A0A420J9W5_9PEZI|nr:GTPase-activating protein [Golovinomyces cichoracearum]